MAKALLTLCCLVVLGMPVLADDGAPFSEAALIGNNAAGGNEVTADQEGDDLVQTVQWGGRGRVWTCRARNRRTGRTFIGQSRNASTARRIALNRCRSRSGGCFITGCR
jgi:hypothetical protein